MSNSKLIDHTLLKAFAKKEEISILCKEAKEHNFKSVCVNPGFVSHAKEELKGTDVLVCTVIGFPLGANTSEVKAFETKDAIKNGAQEIDMVINISAAKDGNFDYVQKDIKAVVDAANGTLVKVIIETCYLTDEEKKKACIAAKNAGADFVKTSTGFGTGGSTPEDVKLMKDTVGDACEVKASGGVRSPQDLEKVVNAGASRIGTSSGIALMAGQNSKTDY